MADVTVLAPRQVPLGGLRALEVRRTLPHKDRSFVGAWCFVDHYGPDAVRDSDRDGMDLPPHPHCGLQTVSWLFAGELEHHDSGGGAGIVRPGEVNLMTAGRGIAHSEVSTPETTSLHGTQLWIVLPDAHRDTERLFEHHAPQAHPVGDGATARVFVGELPGVDRSPVTTFTPLVGAELALEPGASLDLRVDPAFEHGILLDDGPLTLEGTSLAHGELGIVETGPASLHLEAGDRPVRALLLGGEPFEEEIVMWWNLIARSHDEIARAREEYEAGSERFGRVRGYDGEAERIPAPPLPPVHLKPRNRNGHR